MRKYKTNILVSVILPVFKCGNYLSKCLDSIINQSINSFEVIAIYDKSNDNSYEILSKYASQDPRIKIIHGTNDGLIKALNDGIDNATGKYIARMDSDDISTQDRFEKQIHTLESHHADICGGHYYIIGQNDEYLSARVVPCSNDSILLALSLNVPFAHGSVMFRGDFIRDNKIRYGNTSFKYSEDYALWTMMHFQGAKFCNANDWIFKYRDHQASLSKKMLKKVRVDAYKISSSFINLNKFNIKKIIKSLAYQPKTREEAENFATLVFIFLMTELNIKLLFSLSRVAKRDILTGFIRATRFIFFKCFVRA